MQAESPEALTWIGQVIGNHRLVRVLGRGGMGMVFEAVHEGVLGRAAIKILRPDVTSRTDVTTRFFNEARAANAVQHPGIVRIFDCGFTESGVAYLSMEFLEGESLRSRLNKLRQLPTKTALRVARQIASALAAAHRVHIIHRDLKPDKIRYVEQCESKLPLLSETSREVLISLGESIQILLTHWFCRSVRGCSAELRRRPRIRFLLRAIGHGTELANYL